MKKVVSLEDLKHLVYGNWSELDGVNIKYLNDAGLAAKEAYRAIIWHLGFYDTLKSLYEDEEFMNLINIPNKHPEYYNIIRKVSRLLEKVVKGEDNHE